MDTQRDDKTAESNDLPGPFWLKIVITLPWELRFRSYLAGGAETAKKRTSLSTRSPPLKSVLSPYNPYVKLVTSLEVGRWDAFETLKAPISRQLRIPPRKIGNSPIKSTWDQDGLTKVSAETLRNTKSDAIFPRIQVFFYKSRPAPIKTLWKVGRGGQAWPGGTLWTQRPHS